MEGREGDGAQSSSTHDGEGNGETRIFHRRTILDSFISVIQKLYYDSLLQFNQFFLTFDSLELGRLPTFDPENGLLFEGNAQKKCGEKERERTLTRRREAKEPAVRGTSSRARVRGSENV